MKARPKTRALLGNKVKARLEEKPKKKTKNTTYGALW